MWFLDGKDVKNLSIPYNNSTFSKCTRYAVNWTEILDDSGGIPGDVVVDISWPTEGCLDGWIYDRSNVVSSIVIDVSRYIECWQN